MKNNWKDIQEQIRKTQEPLPSGSWELMGKHLDQPVATSIKKRLLIVLAFLLLLVSTFWLLPVNSDQAQEHDKSIRPVENIENISTNHESDQNTSQSLPENELQNTDNPQKPALEIDFQKVDDSVLSQGSNQVVSKADNSVDEENNSPVISSVASSTTEVESNNNHNVAQEVSSSENNFSDQSLSLNAKRILYKAGVSGDFSLIEAAQMPSDTLNAPKTYGSILSKIELHISAGPSMVMNSYERENNPLQQHKGYNDAATGAGRPSVGFQAGIELKYRLFSNLKIGSGFNYLNIVTENRLDYEINEVPVIDSATSNILGYISLSRARRINQSNFNSFRFINIPISLYNEWDISNRWKLTGELTHYISFLLNNSSRGINPITLEVEDQDRSFISNNPVSYKLKLGFQYRLNPHMSMAIEPSYLSYYQNVFTSDGVSWKPQNLTLNLTLILNWSQTQNPKR